MVHCGPGSPVAVGCVHPAQRGTWGFAAERGYFNHYAARIAGLGRHRSRSEERAGLIRASGACRRTHVAERSTRRQPRSNVPQEPFEHTRPHNPDAVGFVAQASSPSQARDAIAIRHHDGRVLSLSREIDFATSLQVSRSGDEYLAEMVKHEIVPRQVVAGGRISNSLFESAAEAGISDQSIMNLAGIFAWDIDFALDIREGDEFVVIFEELWRNGELIKQGDILAAEFVNQGEVFRAIRYVGPKGQIDYFTPQGNNVRKAFVRAPVSFARVSSNFNPRRRHPKLNTIRAHKGVDYAAPSGTPVQAAGDGKVIYRGRKGGYGNAVIIQHGGNITTLYGHLSRFSGKARNGTRVRQGDIIGYVGQTGLATGPHLHYEYRKNGVHMNPRTVTLPAADPIDPALREDFVRASRPMLLRLDAKQQILVGLTASNTT